MNLGSIRSRFIIGIFAAFFVGALTFGAYKAVEPKPAYAQCVCGMICNAISGGASTVMAFLTQNSFLVEIAAIAADLYTAYDTLITGLNGIITTTIGNITGNLSTWYDGFLTYEMKPGMQNEMGQLYTMQVEQSRLESSLIDAENMNETLTEVFEGQADSFRENLPSEEICVSATAVSGVNRARVVSKALKRSLPLVRDGEGGNEVGSMSETGNAQYQYERYQKHLTRYCRATANNGNGCVDAATGVNGASGVFEGEDTRVLEVLFQDKTIDLSDATSERQEVIEDLTRNLIEPEVSDPIGIDALSENPDAQDLFLNKRAQRTQRALAKKVIADVTAIRAPGSRMGPYINEIRQSAGTPVAELSPNPSYLEVLDVVSQERFASGVFNIKNNRGKANVKRQDMTLQALELTIFSDVLDHVDSVSMLEASQVSKDIIDSGALGNGNSEGAVGN